MRERKRIALTGGIATGKSTVAGMFAKLGAFILDADKASRKAVEADSPCRQELLEFLGPDYFGEGGQLERRKLRERIIVDPQCRTRVNAILHPFVYACMDREWEEITAANPGATAIFDIPLLFETGAAHLFDAIILVYVPAEVQIGRLMERDGLTRPEAEKTLTMQLPIESKKALSHFVIDNSSDLESTYRQVRSLWEKITSSLST